MLEPVAIQHGFIINRLPSIGTKVEVLCNVDGRLRPLGVICAWSDNGWIVASTKRHIDCEVVGWRKAKPE